MEKGNKYYFEKSPGGSLLEYCKVSKDRRIRIGSASCSECPNCLDYDNKDCNWLVCACINDAMGSFSISDSGGHTYPIKSFMTISFE